MTNTDVAPLPHCLSPMPKPSLFEVCVQVRVHAVENTHVYTAGWPRAPGCFDAWPRARLLRSALREVGYYLVGYDRVADAITVCSVYYP